MNKNFWNDLSKQGPIVALAPMDGYCDSAFRQVNKHIAPHIIPFSEFYSADGLVHSKDLASRVLPHAESEKPLIIQIFGKDPEKFKQAAILIESYGVSGIDINMGCPAKKVVKSGHGSSLMINRDTAFKIVEEMAKAVKIPISVKTRLGWENHDLLIDFCKGLENAGANLITVHGRTYKQAFTGKADFTGIYELRQALNIPVLCNGDVMNYEDGIEKILHPANRTSNIFSGDERLRSDAYSTGVLSKECKNEGESRQSAFVQQISGSLDEIHTKFEHRSDAYSTGTLSEERRSEGESRQNPRNLDGFMIGRGCFGNPWAFTSDNRKPTLEEILQTMELHARLLIETKGPKGALEIRKHLVQYLHGFSGVKEYRTRLVHTEKLEDVLEVTKTIRGEHSDKLNAILVNDGEKLMEAWDQCNG